MREDEREGERGRSLNGDRPTTIPTELLAVVRRFRESNLSCDHLRECLNELLGVGPGPTSLRGLLSARHLVWECGPNRNKRRTETTDAAAAAAEKRRRERKDLFFSGGGERRPESTYLPVGLLLNPRSRLMDSSSPGRCMRTYDTNRPAPASFLVLPSPLLFPSRLRVSRDASTKCTSLFYRVQPDVADNVDLSSIVYSW